MSITWREELAIGVEQIDSQHKELLARFDMLLNACKLGKGKDELTHLLNFLDEYVVSHFSDEEVLQKQSGFPDYEAHREEHAAFIARVKELKTRMDQDGEITISHLLDTNKMLMDWLLRHITVRDREVGRHIKSQSAS